MITNSIPNLDAFNQWFLWQWVPNGNHAPRKIPVDARNPKLTWINPHGPQFWLPLIEAMILQEHYKQLGKELNLGFDLTPFDPIACVDLDGCRHPDTGDVEPWAQQIVDELGSYTEISPSGTGLKIFVMVTDKSMKNVYHKFDDKPDICPKKPGIEIFFKGQFIAFTGWKYQHDAIEERSAQVHALVQQYGKGKDTQGQLAGFQDNPEADEATVAAAEAFIMNMDPAISGAGGHNATFAVACRLMLDFALSRSQAMEIFSEWNYGCSPPWEQKELERKLRDAGKRAGGRGGSSPTTIRAGLLRHVKEQEQSFGASAAQLPIALDPETFVPFPVHVLPRPLSDFIKTVAASIGCDPSFVALPVLTVCAAAIGNTRRLVVKDGWQVPSILWGVIVGESGTLKSPALKAAQKPIQERQQQWFKKYHEEIAAFEAAEEERKQRMKHPLVPAGEVPVEKVVPIRQRCLVSDATIEGLVSVLSDNWRGVLLIRDELAGWIGSFDKYNARGKASADAGHWLSLYNGASITVDRKTGDRPTVFVPQPAVSICGGIQPGILDKMIGSEHRDNGLLSRLLLAFPPRRQKQWTDASIPQEIEAGYDAHVCGLLNLKGNVFDEEPSPQKVRLSTEASDLFKQYVDRNGAEQFKYTGDLAAAWSKLEEIPARLALVIHCVRCVAGDCSDPLICDADSMRAGIELATWFKNETLRVYRRMAESSDQRRRRELCEWIAQKGGRVRSRELVSGRRDVKTATDADGQLQELVNAGLGRWETIQNISGPAAREFVLFP